MHNLKRVCPENVAYVLVQVCLLHAFFWSIYSTTFQGYFALSTVESWCTNDRYFKLDKFHSLIVDVLSDDTEPWVVETLDYLTQYSLFHTPIVQIDIFSEDRCRR